METARELQWQLIKLPNAHIKLYVYQNFLSMTGAQSNVDANWISKSI